MKQTLAQWLEQHPERFVDDTQSRGGIKAIHIGPGDPGYKDLFNLSDHGVDGLYSGPFLHLWPRTPATDQIPAAQAMTRESKVQKFVDTLLTEEGGERYLNHAGLGRAFGLQPGELYDQEEEVHTGISHEDYKGHDIESWYNEMSSGLQPWSAFVMGIGSTAGMSREEAISAMKAKIDSAAVNPQIW